MSFNKLLNFSNTLPVTIVLNAHIFSWGRRYYIKILTSLKQ